MVSNRKTGDSKHPLFYKIVNVETASKFFYDTIKDYIPPPREFTGKWIKMVLKGQKKHIKLNKVNWIFDYKGINLTTKTLYKTVKDDAAVNVYLPNYTKS